MTEEDVNAEIKLTSLVCSNRVLFIISIFLQGDLTITLRDPSFFRWHAFVDDMFQEHKQRLPQVNSKTSIFP